MLGVAQRLRGRRPRGAVLPLNPSLPKSCPCPRRHCTTTHSPRRRRGGAVVGRGATGSCQQWRCGLLGCTALDGRYYCCSYVPFCLFWEISNSISHFFPPRFHFPHHTGMVRIKKWLVLSRDPVSLWQAATVSLYLLGP